MLAFFLLATPAHAQIAVSGAWARATAPGQTTGAVYLSLDVKQADRLTGVSSGAADMAMLHQTSRTGSMSSMMEIGAMDLAGGSRLVLAPGGRHIMLMGLKHRLAAGSRIGVDLDFAKAGIVHVDVPVQPISADGPPP